MPGDDTRSEEQPVLVPHDRVPPDTLRRIAEDFCTRDGTDYGEVEMSLDARVALLMRQLDGGQAHLVYEASSETLRILTDDERRALEGR